MTARVVETWALDSDGGFVSNADDSVYSPSDVVTVLNTLTARVDALLVDNETESDRLIAARLDVSRVTRERDEAVELLRRYERRESLQATRGQYAAILNNDRGTVESHKIARQHFNEATAAMQKMDRDNRAFLSRLDAKGGAL